MEVVLPLMFSLVFLKIDRTILNKKMNVVLVSEVLRFGMENVEKIQT
jgi:hypothetical protein